MKADVPVVPVISLDGQHLFSGIFKWGHPVITVRFGKPLRLQDDMNSGADARNETTRIMVAIVELLPPERRGMYADVAREGSSSDAKHAVSGKTNADKVASN